MVPVSATRKLTPVIPIHGSAGCHRGVGGGERQPPPGHAAEGPGAAPGLDRHPRAAPPTAARHAAGSAAPGPSPGARRRGPRADSAIQASVPTARIQTHQGVREADAEGQAGTSAPSARAARGRQDEPASGRPASARRARPARRPGTARRRRAGRGGSGASRLHAIRPGHGRGGNVTLQERREGTLTLRTNPTTDRLPTVGMLSREPAGPPVSALVGRTDLRGPGRHGCWLHTHPHGHSDVGPPATICTGGPWNPVSPTRRCQHAPDLHDRAKSQVSGGQRSPRIDEKISPVLGVSRQDTPSVHVVGVRITPAGRDDDGAGGGGGHDRRVEQPRPRRARSSVGGAAGDDVHGEVHHPAAGAVPDQVAVISRTSPARTGARNCTSE